MAYDRQDVGTLGEDELKSFIKVKMGEMEAIAKDDGLKSLNTDGIEDWKSRNDELTDARARHAALREVSSSFKEQKEQHQREFKSAHRSLPFATGDDEMDDEDRGSGGYPGLNFDEFKSLGERFVESANYKAVAEMGKGTWDPKVSGNLTKEVDGVSIKSLDLSAMKATMVTTSGWAPYPTMSPKPPVLMGIQQPVVADLIPQDDTTQPAILYYEETTFTENADFVAEGGTKPEAALQLTLRSMPVVKVAVTLPISEEQIMDVPQVRGYIDGRLTLMVKRKEEWGLLNGTGVAPQLRGFHNVPGIGSITRGAAEDNPDAILRAITDVNLIQGYANATGIVMNPLQWLAIRLLRTKTGDYIWGHPAVQGPSTLWGLPVISTNAQDAGRALVGDFQMYSHISRRMGIRIDIGYIDKDFINDIQRIRLEERLSLEVYRNKAFEEILGLNAAPTS